MSRLVARAETWERVYDAFDVVNFAAFDYATVKQSLLDYIKLTFPESFNDFIESSELIAIIESFAYVAELLAYRIDVAAHENFLATAQRKDNILRLAKLLSYTASRPLPARGLVKITSISTTESVFDTNGTQLANRTIRWNDPSNPYWKEQFIIVLNKILDQEVGNVSPTDRFQIQDVLFELYSLKNTPLTNGVVPYSAVANGRSVPMELVPVEYDSVEGIVERRPTNNSSFTILYGTDGMGDGSNTTGFFCFTKQGILQKFTTNFDGVTPSQKYVVPATNVNDIDVWVNQVDPTTGNTLDDPESSYGRVDPTGKSGEWAQVDIAHAQNITFNTNPKRNKYEVETRDNNQVRLIFGDGEFANIPGGTFDVWVRSSLDEDITVPQSAVVDVPTTFTYTNDINQTPSCSITFSLIGTLQNASASESLDHIKLVAPAVYYTQDRMVNGKDYNVFPLQDPSILKLRAVNRTFAGDSKYIPWHDSSSTYENVKIFGDDACLYFEDQLVTVTTPNVVANDLINAYVEPLLSSTDMYVRIVSETNAQYISRKFTPEEQQSLIEALTASGTPAAASIYYKKTTNTWHSISGVADGTSPGVDPAVDLASAGWVNGSTNPFISDPLIIIRQVNSASLVYDVSRASRRLTVESPTTQFWSNNDGNNVISYDTLRTEYDQIVILQSNVNHSRNGLLQRNWRYDVLGRSVVGVGTDIGLPNDNKVIVIPMDENGDTVPDSLTYAYPSTDGVADIITPKVSVTIPVSSLPYTLTLPIYYIPGKKDVYVHRNDTNTAFTNFQESSDAVSNTITILPGAGYGTELKLTVSVNDYVYFTRYTSADDWEPAPTTLNSMYRYISDVASSTTATSLWTRRVGRSGLNFMWTHTSPRYHLVDPSPTNIIDMFIITRGYYNELRRWLQDSSNVSRPATPTPLELRTTYSRILDNKMSSDTVVLHPGRVKLLFGDKAAAELRGVFKVVRSDNSALTDNQVKTTVVTTIRNFFDMSRWEFGETFYVTELIAAIHNSLRADISSVVLVPLGTSSQFGDIFQIRCQEDEIFYCDIGVEDIEVVQSYNPNNIRLNG